MPSTVERFWAKVTPSDDGCLVWTAQISSSGYGRFRINTPRSTVQAHRWAYEEIHGPIPDGLTIDHLCRNRACVNPDHLEPVTQGENVRRGLKGRMVTHCPSGHEYDSENTYVDPKGLRHCRACRRDRERARYRTLHARG